MSLSYNGTELQSITWNGADVQSVTMDGVEVWSASFRVDENTLALLHFDSGVLTDVAGKYTWATRGTPTLNTSNKKFGEASLDTHNGNIVVNGGGGMINFPSGTAFTMEAWVYLTAYPSAIDYGNLFSKWRHGLGTDFMMGIAETGKLTLRYSSYTYIGGESTEKVPLNEWVHIAIARDTTGPARAFINGKTAFLYSQGYFDGGCSFAIGGSGEGRLAHTQYLIDEVRISNVCRYTENFTPR